MLVYRREMLKEHVHKLTSLGLSDKEARVYLTLLNEGALAIDHIAAHSGMNRSTTYVQLTALTKNGLVSSYKKGKKVIFSAESPNNIAGLLDRYALELEQKRSEVNLVLPELMKVFGNTGERPVVRIFEGKEGLKSMRNEILDQQPKNVYIIASVDDMHKVYTTKEMNDFTALREQKKIHSHVLFSSEKEIEITPYKHQSLKRVKKETLPFGSDVYIYNDTVSFASVGDRVIGMTVTNRGIAQTMHAMFNVLWQKL